MAGGLFLFVFGKKTTDLDCWPTDLDCWPTDFDCWPILFSYSVFYIPRGGSIFTQVVVDAPVLLLFAPDG